MRRQHGSVQQRIFEGLKKMIAVRKTTPAFTDYNNRELLETNNSHLFVFMRNNPFRVHDRVLVVGNFDSRPQSLSMNELPLHANLDRGRLQDLYSGSSPELVDDRLLLPPHGFYWLADQA